MPDYELRIMLINVADGDVTDLANDIWDSHSEAFDASKGEFQLAISKDGFPFDWDPNGLTPA